MKKNSIAFSFSLIPVLVSCYLGHVFDEHLERRGMDQYNPNCSSIALCKYLTCREHLDVVAQGFLDLFEYASADFMFVYDFNGPISYETAFLRVDYEARTYQEAISDIRSQKGYEPGEICSYQGYAFHINLAEEVLALERGSRSWQTKFDLESEEPYIRWINLIGERESTGSIAMLGFFYSENHDLFRDTEKATFYPFSGWPVLFSDFFSAAPWDAD